MLSLYLQIGAASSVDLMLVRRPLREILILLGNQRAQSRTITDALTAAGVPFESPQQNAFIDSDVGRFVLAVLRIVCDTNDYVAHRFILACDRALE